MALPPPTSQRGSHSSAKDLDASMATVVIVVACASAAAFALHAALRLILRRLRARRPSDKPAEGAMTTTPPPQLLPGSVLFAAGATAVAGATECAICLAELAEGERVRVMPACGHGFHAHCVDAWLVSRSSSCPTCRTEWWPADEEAAVET